MLRSINNNCCRRRGVEGSNCGGQKGARNGARAAICGREDQSLQGCLACKVTVAKGIAGCKPDCPKGAKKKKKSTSLCPHQPASPALWGSWRLLIKKESSANSQLSRNCPSLQNGGQEGLQCRLATWLSWSLQLGEGAGRETFSNFTAWPPSRLRCQPRLAWPVVPGER